MKLLMTKYKLPALLPTVSTPSATSGTSLAELYRRKDSIDQHIVI